MLCITRHGHEGFAIGDDVFVKVMDIGHGQVRIGIHAPREVDIVREELVSEAHPLFDLIVEGQMDHDLKKMKSREPL